MTAPPPRPKVGLLLTADPVVFDTTFPRHLAQLGSPYVKVLLRTMFAGRAVIPEAVDRELTLAGQLHAPAARALVGRFPFATVIGLSPDDADKAEALRKELPAKTFAKGENRGEAQAIILAQTLGAPLVIDEGDGTRAAIGRGVATFGCVHVFLLAAVENHYTDDQAWDAFRGLITSDDGLRLPQDSIWTPDDAGEARFRGALETLRGK